MPLVGTHENRISPSVVAYAKISDALGASRYRSETGNRMIQAGDDSSSLSVATKLQSQTSTLRSSLVNGARATSYLQIASQGLSQIREILESLSVFTEAANATGQTGLSYAKLDAQFQRQLAQIDTVVAATTFNGSSILDGSTDNPNAPTVQVGDASGTPLALAIPSVTQASLFASTPTIGNAAGATSATVTVANAQDIVADAIAKVEAYQLRLDVADAAVKRDIYGLSTGISGLIDTDQPKEARDQKRLNLQQNTAATLIGQALKVNSDLLRLL